MLKIKRVLTVIVLVITAFLLASCGGESKKEINGEVTMEIEVFSEFIDPGIIYPEDYTLVTDGKVDSRHIGKHELKYSVYTPKGELAKELYRFVDVLDKTSPTYKLSLVSNI